MAVESISLSIFLKVWDQAGMDRTCDPGSVVCIYDCAMRAGMLNFW